MPPLSVKSLPKIPWQISVQRLHPFTAFCMMADEKGLTGMGCKPYLYKKKAE
jgi:hypothetical protein